MDHNSAELFPRYIELVTFQFYKDNSLYITLNLLVTLV